MMLAAVGVAVPLARSDGVDVHHVHGVNLLQGTVLGLDEEEEDDENKDRTTSCKDEAVEVVDGVNDEAGAVKVSNGFGDTGMATYKKEMRKFQSQLAAVARAMQRPRYCVGYSSATAAQTIGPQVVAKAAIARQEKVTRTAPAAGVLRGFSLSRAKCPTKA